MLFTDFWWCPLVILHFFVIFHSSPRGSSILAFTYTYTGCCQSCKHEKSHETGRRDRFLSSDRSCGHGSTPRNISQASIWVKSDIFDTFFGQNLADMNLFLYLCSRYAGMDRYENYRRLLKKFPPQVMFQGSYLKKGVQAGPGCFWSAWQLNTGRYLKKDVQAGTITVGPHR